MFFNSQSLIVACASALLSSNQLLASAQAPLQDRVPFFSRPDINPPAFTWTIFDPTLVTPGYMLLTPYTAPPQSALAAAPQALGAALSALSSPATGGCTLEILEALLSAQIQNGPYIYDMDGTLVYSGFGATGGQLAHNLKVAEHQGQTVLTYYQGNDRQGGNRGHGVIMNQKYSTVASVQSGNGRAPGDVHEFTVLPGGTALMTIFQPRPYDLSPYGVNQQIGWVVDGIFQEIDISSGKVLFEWSALDHVPLNQTYNSLGSNAEAGFGNTTALAWDYFHLNSIDKDTNGDYIISSRYCSTIFKISHLDGSIIWQLNGKNSSFALIDFPTSSAFNFQHMPRILSSTSTTTVLSVFDNGSDGFITASNSSSGKIISLETAAMTATLLNTYTNPPITTILTTSQGSMQVLNNSNVFIGWGSIPEVSEFTSSGQCVAFGAFGIVNLASSYRSTKIPTSAWIGQPDSTPAIFTYANSSSLPTTFYVSWNGATQVAKWRFFGGDGTDATTMEVVGSAVKVGFETQFTTTQYFAYGFAKALDVNGKVLGISQVVQTFVPYSFEIPGNGTITPPANATNATSPTQAIFRKRWTFKT